MDGRRQAVLRAQAAESTNVGLWLDRFLGPQKPHPKKEKEAELVEFEKRRKEVSKITSAEDYRHTFARREQALRQTNGGFDGGTTRVFMAKATSRIAMGLGQASVWENGMSLSRTWGTPIIPGSALKGLVSAYAARHGNEDWQKPDAADGQKGRLQALLFGSLDQAGEVTFHDAWWDPKDGGCPIDRDVLTVHHQDYYRGKPTAPNEDTAPADWDDPNPVGFFTSWGEFLVALSGPLDAVNFAAQLLERALAEEGIGAKTNAGYGRMTLAPKLTEEEYLQYEQQKQRELELATRREKLAKLSKPIPAKDAAELANRLKQLFSTEYTEAEQREGVAALLTHSRPGVKNWADKDPMRPGATLVQEELSKHTANSNSAAPPSSTPDKAAQAERFRAKVTFTVSSKEVTLDAIEGRDCKPGQKAAAIAGKSPNAEAQKAQVKQLAGAGPGVHQREAFVTMSGNKVLALEFDA
jgi:CRISPR-associated protein Cmr6